MNLAGFLLRSRGIPSLAKRIPGLFVRFGVTEHKIASCLHSFVDITERFNAYPTFAITANLVSRYPTLVRDLQDRGVEFAIHGLVHTDYARLSFDEQRDHIQRAIHIFADQGIEFSGFRCPYLSSNHDTIRAVGDLGLKWESSDVVSWDVVDLSEYTPRQLEAYNKIIDVYNATSMRTEKSLPKLINGVVEIPVSVPDDDILVDRLGIKNPAEVMAVWLDILRHSYERGELFTIQLHHERIGFCGMALTQVLTEARTLQPAVWVAQLKDIADWAYERNGTELKFEIINESRLRAKVEGSNRATVLVKNLAVDAPSKEWADGYRLVESNEFEVTSRVKPVIGASQSLPAYVIAQLEGEGFIVEVSDSPSDYGVYLDGIDGESHHNLVAAIEESGQPLIRLWRWPYGAKSALSCTGDIDSITILDFARRFIEV